INDDISFIRVLGFNNLGKDYLKSIKKNINIYTNIKEDINMILDIELKTSKLLDSIYNINLLKLEQKGPIYKKA
nr:nucleotidyltransferase family protein [Acholeplasmatales bacterium]